MGRSEAGPFDDADEAALVDLLRDLQRESARTDLPRNLATLARNGEQQVSALLDAVLAGDRMGVEDILLGTLKEDGTRTRDGIRQILPNWARGRAVLEALNGIVVVDESQDPVTVTVHWERVPRKLRPAAASLASEMVDTYQPRPRGGRPPKSPAKIPRKPGDPDTGAPPV